jgi:hypothetical protein
MAAERLQRWISVRSLKRAFYVEEDTDWQHYCDSVGGVQSICPCRVPS